tara:strand:- start:80 stop:328 length:249 start_codon:yes stop_codon:yes gene_type:complete
MSPYPTVVNVTTVHQRELNNELNLFSPSSAKIYSNRYIPNVEVNKNEGIKTIKNNLIFIIFICKFSYSQDYRRNSFSLIPVM